VCPTHVPSQRVSTKQCLQQNEHHLYSRAESEEELTTSFQDLLNGCPKQIRTEVYLDNQVLSFRALMDTGMDFNMIRQDIVLRNNLVVSEYHGPAVETIDTNRKFRPVGQVELQVGFPQGGRLRTYYEYFLVPPADVELNFDLAIGNPFINNAKILILNPQGFCLAHNKQSKGMSAYSCSSQIGTNVSYRRGAESEGESQRGGREDQTRAEKDEFRQNEEAEDMRNQSETTTNEQSEASARPSESNGKSTNDPKNDHTREGNS